MWHGTLWFEEVRSGGGWSRQDSKRKERKWNEGNKKLESVWIAAHTEEK